MTQVDETRRVGFSPPLELARALRPAGPEWLREIREQGLNRFEQVGFPTIKHEEWRFSNFAPLARMGFQVPPVPSLAEAGSSGQWRFGDEAACELVFVDGHYVEELSSIGGLPAGVKVMRLATAIREAEELLKRHVGQYADIQGNPFVALNAAFLDDGVVVHLARGARLERPVHILWHGRPARVAGTMGGPPMPHVSHPRVLVVADEGSEGKIVETYAGTGGVYWTNSVTEVALGPGARLEHCRVNQESLDAYHTSATHVQLAAGACYTAHSAELGGLLTRNDVSVVLGGERAEATLNGLTMIGGKQHVDNHTLLDHAAAHCPSHELYKAVLGGQSTGVFKGKILVRPDSQKTDSKQTSRTLLLTDDAQMNSMPALEIYADDVKCTHGSTTGPVDEEQVFYLRSRGVSLAAARHLLTYAFAADVTGRIGIMPVRRRLEEIMAAQHGLPRDLRIAEGSGE